MANRQLDFHVIYNRALSSKAETDDTRLSSEFTEYLVNLLEDDGKRTGYFPERDSIPGKNVFNVLRDNIKNAHKTIVVVSPEFIRNCWQTYSHQSAFKQLIDAGQSEKLLPIALDIEEEEKLSELNISEWIHFDKDYKNLNNKRNENNWILLQKAVDSDRPWTQIKDVTTVQECGDNRLRTEQRGDLVTHPTSLNANKDFFSDALIMKISEQLPSDWKFLCIQLGLSDNETERIRQNYPPPDTKMQAFKGLLGAMKVIGGNDEIKLGKLKAALETIGRLDVVADVETKYQEYQERNRQSNNSNNNSSSNNSNNTNHSNNSNNSNNNNNHTTTVQVVDASLSLSLGELQLRSQEEGVDTVDASTNNSMESDFMSRELRPSELAMINTQQAPSARTPQSISMDAGPSMSLPPAPVVQLPTAPSMKLPNSSVVTNDRIASNGTTGLRQTYGDERKNGQSSDHSRTSTKSKTARSPPNIQQVNSGDDIKATNIAENSDNTLRKSMYEHQPSLSADTDITLDNGERVEFQQNHTRPPPEGAAYSPLDKAEMLDLKSLDCDPISIDSGLCSVTDTPVGEGAVSLSTPEDGMSLMPVEEVIAPALNMASNQAPTMSASSTSNHSSKPADGANGISITAPTESSSNALRNAESSSNVSENAATSSACPNAEHSSFLSRYPSNCCQVTSDTDQYSEVTGDTDPNCENTDNTAGSSSWFNVSNVCLSVWRMITRPEVAYNP